MKLCLIVRRRWEANAARRRPRVHMYADLVSSDEHELLLVACS